MVAEREHPVRSEMWTSVDTRHCPSRAHPLPEPSTSLPARPWPCRRFQPGEPYEPSFVRLIPSEFEFWTAIWDADDAAGDVACDVAGDVASGVASAVAGSTRSPTPDSEIDSNAGTPNGKVMLPDSTCPDGKPRT